MKGKYGIGSLVVIFACVVLFSGAYYLSYSNQKQKQQAEAEENAKSELDNESMRFEEEQSVATEGEAAKSAVYYLLPLNGYVVVYRSDRSTVYEYTNIAMEDLPETVRTEVENGKEIATDEELYGFLENYSS